MSDRPLHRLEGEITLGSTHAVPGRLRIGQTMISLSEDHLAWRLFVTDARVLSIVARNNDSGGLPKDELFKRAWEREQAIRQECVLRAKSVFEAK